MRGLVVSVLCLSFRLFAAEGEETVSSSAQEVALLEPVDIKKISETFGHLIAKNLLSVGNESGVRFDIAQIIKGLQDASDGLQAPMTETECIEAIAAAQEIVIQKLSRENLEKAERFLEENEKKDGVITIKAGKLQCKILKEGDGFATVDESCSPLISYKGKLLNDETPFGASREPEIFDLHESIPGFREGIIGMKKGEMRELYIHPDLAYGTKGTLPRNSLITFQVEVVEVDSPFSDNRSDPLSSTSSSRGNPEIVHPMEEVKVLR